MSAISQERTLVAKKTVENFVTRAIRLDEQEPGEAEASARLGSYVRRWVGWTGAGLGVDAREVGCLTGYHGRTYS